MPTAVDFISPGFEFGEKEEFMIQFASIFKSYSPDAASFTKHHI